MKMACGKRGALQRVGWHGKGESGRYGCLCVCDCGFDFWYGAERRGVSFLRAVHCGEEVLL